MSKNKRKKKEEPSAQRNMVIKNMILHNHAKTWDARERRNKDNRKKRQVFEEGGSNDSEA